MHNILGLLIIGMVARFQTSKVANYINAAWHYLMPLDIKFRICIQLKQFMTKFMQLLQNSS